MRRVWGGPGRVFNASGRILASNDSRRATGALLRIDGLSHALAPLHEEHSAQATLLPGGELVVPCGDTTLALVAEDPAAG